MDMNVPTITNAYPTLNYSKQDFERSLEVAGSESENEQSQYFGMDPETILSQVVANQLQKFNPGLPDFISYQGLVNGTAGWFDTLPDEKDKPPNQRALTSQQILQLFVKNRDTGDFVQTGDFLQGMKKGTVPGAAGFTAFNLAAAKTNALLQANPLTAVPLTLPQFLIRAGTPLVAGTISAIAAQTTARNLQESIFPDTRLVLPSTTTGETFGQILTENLPYVFQPKFISDKVNLGALNILSNNQSAYTPVKMVKSKITGKMKVKIPLGFKLTRGTENLLMNMKAEAKANPFRFYRTETAALVGSTALGTAAVEAGAGPVGQLLSELGGGVSGGLASDIIFGTIGSTIKGGTMLYEGITEKGLLPALSDIKDSFKGRNQRNVQNFLIETIYKQFPDSPEGRKDAQAHINEIINNLSDKNLNKALSAYAAEKGIPVPQITAGVASRSPIILGLEKALEATSLNLGQQRGKANEQAIEAYRNSILAMYATGDPLMVRKAAELTKMAFENDLQKGLDQSNNALMRAFVQLKGGRENEFSVESLSELGDAIQKNLLRNKIEDSARGRKLWEAVGVDTEISSFIDMDGNQTDVPNFMSVWEDIFNKSDAPESWDDESKIVSSLIRFTERKRNELGLNIPLNTSAEGIQTPGSGKAFTNFQKIFEESRGTNGRARFLRGLVEEGIISDENIEATDINTILDAVPNEGIDDAVEKLGRLAKRLSPDRSDRKVFADFEIKNMKISSGLADSVRKALIEKQQRAQTPDAPVSGDDFEFKPVTVGELISMRSKALEIGRNNPDSNKIQDIVGQFASAIERDLDSFPEGTNTEYDIARAYTKALKDVYTRSYVGDIVAKTKAGDLKMEPEQVARNLMAGGAAYRRSLELDQMGQFQMNTQITAAMESGLGRFSQIPAVQTQKDKLLKQLDKTKNKTGTFDFVKLRKFLKNNKEELENIPGIKYIKVGKKVKAVEGDTLYNNLLNTVYGAIDLRATKENVLRLIRAEAFNEDDPAKVQAQSLLKWTQKSENKLLLKSYPDLLEDINDIVKGNDSKLAMFEEAKIQARNKTNEQKEMFSFYALLGTKDESPTTVIAKAIDPMSNRPISNLDALWKVVKKAPDEFKGRYENVGFLKKDAIQGFKSALLESVLLNGRGGKPNPLAYYRTMFGVRDRSKDKISIADWAVKNKVFSEVEMKNIEEMFLRMIEFEGTVMQGGSGEDVEGLMAQLGPGADLILSVLGSSVGTRVQQMLTGGGTGAQLIAAGRGAAAFRDTYRSVLLNTPNILKMDLLKDMISNPTLLVAALRKGKTPQENRAIAQYILDYVSKRGYTVGMQLPKAAGVTIEPGPMVPPVDEEEEATTSGVQGITDQNRPVQRDAPPATNISMVSPTLNPVPNTQPVNRKRFAALFPEDAALIEGIGSLRG